MAFIGAVIISAIASLTAVSFIRTRSKNKSETNLHIFLIGEIISIIGFEKLID
ncbi:hypothetical protein NMY3_00369 [Candidatus Nitrosocosmicus oleophilus]|uniref:Uncharacterized protein n=1 Tax=Candidatus Nitrosocosmicus oleophilus TaxID=1353260 RepID=A0A654LW80_9ARCH|nr:hypothetical protein [Candidatus Nitrosocosmicus oleophilus]ALI34583.1 hypothetical protein NMY3_00369 [Candidatus Nitrosocosmicus oleophilus]